MLELFAMKTILLVDGENFKGMIRDSLYPDRKNVAKIIWHTFDFRGLFDRVLKDISIDEGRFYFARIKEHEKTREKSKKLIEDQRRLKTHLENQGFKVVLGGSVRGYMTKNASGKEALTFKEKGVDVKIAIDMVTLACDKLVDEIILASSDSDLQPAIREITNNRDVSCIYLGFESKPNKGITYTTNRSILIRNSEINEFKEVQQTLNI